MFHPLTRQYPRAPSKTQPCHVQEKQMHVCPIDTFNRFSLKAVPQKLDYTKNNESVCDPSKAFIVRKKTVFPHVENNSLAYRGREAARKSNLNALKTALVAHASARRPHASSLKGPCSTCSPSTSNLYRRDKSSSCQRNCAPV